MVNTGWSSLTFVFQLFLLLIPKKIGRLTACPMAIFRSKNRCLRSELRLRIRGVPDCVYVSCYILVVPTTGCAAGAIWLGYNHGKWPWKVGYNPEKNHGWLPVSKWGCTSSCNLRPASQRLIDCLWTQWRWLSQDPTAAGLGDLQDGNHTEWSIPSHKLISWFTIQLTIGINHTLVVFYILFAGV